MKRDGRAYAGDRADAQLLTQLSNLDSEALTQVYNQFHTPLYRYIAFHVNEVQVAEDLTSEVFTRLLVALKNGNAPRNSVKQWLFGVARHVVNDHYRQKSRWKLTRLTDFLSSSAESPDQKISQKMDNDQLRQQLEKLNKNQRHVLALRFGYGMSIREVANLLEKSEGAVKMLQVRALAALAQVMEA